MGDLVQPRSGVLGLLERRVVLVCLDERVLRHIGGDFRVAHHPQQVRVDLALVLAEDGLDEDRRLVAIPDAAHGASSVSPEGVRTAVWDAQVDGLGFEDHEDSVGAGCRARLQWVRTPVSPETRHLPHV